MDQQIQYCTTPDGVRLAYSIIGKGKPMVRTPHWFAHLENDLTSPAFRHSILGLAQHHALLRYDPRGVGLSQRDNIDVSFEKFVSDLETVVDCAKLDKFILIGLSQGCAQAIAYAARHPQRLTHLILFGGFARGVLQRDGDPEKKKQGLDLICGLVRQGWGSNEESHRQFFTSQFMPDSTREIQHALNDTQRHATTPEMAERFLIANAAIDVTQHLAKITTPTLVLYPTGDLRVPFAEGQLLASSIPGAKLIPLDTRNHMIVADDPAHRQMLDAIADFLGEKRTRGHLPGTTGFSERLEHNAKAIEQHWLVRFVLVFAAITGCLIFFYELWKLYRGGRH
jgi:pimeloyl-ACP methyl ester carboxylesterase